MEYGGILTSFGSMGIRGCCRIMLFVLNFMRILWVEIEEFFLVISLKDSFDGVGGGATELSSLFYFTYQITAKVGGCAGVGKDEYTRHPCKINPHCVTLPSIVA